MLKNSQHANFSSYKSIEDRFIDDCLEYDQIERVKQDYIQTDLKLSSQKHISINDFSSEKNLGRWTIDESFAYLNTLRNFKRTKQIVKDLLRKLPRRVQPQIRSHHKKMLKKYGSIEQIIRCLDLQCNYKLIQINRRLDYLDQKLQRLCQNDF